LTKGVKSSLCSESSYLGYSYKGGEDSAMTPNNRNARNQSKKHFISFVFKSKSTR